MKGICRGCDERDEDVGVIVCKVLLRVKAAEQGSEILRRSCLTLHGALQGSCAGRARLKRHVGEHHRNLGAPERLILWNGFQYVRSELLGREASTVALRFDRGESVDSQPSREGGRDLLEAALAACRSSVRYIDAAPRGASCEARWILGVEPQRPHVVLRHEARLTRRCGEFLEHERDRTVQLRGAARPLVERFVGRVAARQAGVTFLARRWTLGWKLWKIRRYLQDVVRRQYCGERVGIQASFFVIPDERCAGFDVVRAEGGGVAVERCAPFKKGVAP